MRNLSTLAKIIASRSGRLFPVTFRGRYKDEHGLQSYDHDATVQLRWNGVKGEFAVVAVPLFISDSVL